MDKVCKVCGKTFEPRHNASKYCSEACANVIRWKHDHRGWESDDQLWHGICEHCGKAYTSAHKKRFCTDECLKQECLDKAIKKRKQAKGTCRVCGKQLPVGRWMYCSDECNPKHDRGREVLLTDAMVKARIAERYDSIEHVSGHTSGGKIVVRCKACGREFETGERSSRVTYDFSCSHHKAPVAKKEYKAPMCIACGKEFNGKTNERYCSDDCRKAAARQKGAEASRAKHDSAVKPRACKSCGVVFIPEYGSKHRCFCSNECCKRYSRKDGKRTRRARKRGAYVSKVDYREIFDRDKGTCQLCGKRINISHKVPAWDSGTIDHIVPLALGGTHEPRNVQLAHFICNVHKGIKPMNEQTRLI